MYSAFNRLNFSRIVSKERVPISPMAMRAGLTDPLLNEGLPLSLTILASVKEVGL